MSVGVAQNLCSSLRIDCALLGAGQSGNFSPWTVNSLLNICILKVFCQSPERYFQIAINPFLIVSVTGIQVLLFVGFLAVWSFLFRLMKFPFPPSGFFFTTKSQGCVVERKAFPQACLTYQAVCLGVQQRPQEAGGSVLHIFHLDALTSPISKLLWLVIFMSACGEEECAKCPRWWGLEEARQLLCVRWSALGGTNGALRWQMERRRCSWAVPCWHRGCGQAAPWKEFVVDINNFLLALGFLMN